MTAVAMGAAIFAESRDWKSGIAEAKKIRSVTRGEGSINIEYGYPERTPDSQIRVRVRAGSDALKKGYRIQIDSDMGWTSGQLDLDTISAINDIPVGRRGDNHFRVLVFDALGTPLLSAETRFTVKRVDATSSGTPLTHTIAVKVVEGSLGMERNVLADLIEKGHVLPASGTREFKAARDLKFGDKGYLDFEVYQREFWGLGSETVSPRWCISDLCFRFGAGRDRTAG